MVRGLLVLTAVGLVVVPPAGCNEAERRVVPTPQTADTTLSPPPCFIEVARRLASLGSSEVGVLTAFPDAKGLAEGRPLVVEGRVAQYGQIRVKRAGIEAEVRFSRFVVQEADGVLVTEDAIDEARDRTHRRDDARALVCDEGSLHLDLLVTRLQTLRLALVDGCEVEVRHLWPFGDLLVPGDMTELPADVRGLLERATAMGNAASAAAERRKPTWEGYAREERRQRVDAFAAWLKHYVRLLGDVRAALTR